MVGDKYEFEGKTYVSEAHYNCDGCAFEGNMEACKLSPPCAEDLVGVSIIWVGEVSDGQDKGGG